LSFSAGLPIASLFHPSFLPATILSWNLTPQHCRAYHVGKCSPLLCASSVSPLPPLVDALLPGLKSKKFLSSQTFSSLRITSQMLPPNFFASRLPVRFPCEANDSPPALPIVALRPDIIEQVCSRPLNLVFAPFFRSGRFPLLSSLSLRQKALQLVPPHRVFLSYPAFCCPCRCNKGCDHARLLPRFFFGPSFHIPSPRPFLFCSTPLSLTRSADHQTSHRLHFHPTAKVYLSGL